MEPIPYYYDHVNRSAILVKARQPWYDWINNIYPDSPTTESSREPNVYLIKTKDNNQVLLNWIKIHFDEIFQNELNDWHIDENDWPQKRTFTMFKLWFEFEVCSMVLDIEDSPITK